MRTNIVIDDKLMADALRITGLKTKREAVELGLRTLIGLWQQEAIRAFRGKLHWEGDLEFFQRSPLAELDLERDRSPVRPEPVL
ncbi:MAG TPA: DUF2191 domain-containing protein [Acidobacteria bacterium]|nr:DUF2191 domain-containing protein [Acidobacteriota bacterium]